MRLVSMLVHVDVYVCGSSHMAAGPWKVKAGGVSMIGQLSVHLLDALGSKGDAWIAEHLLHQQVWQAWTGEDSLQCVGEARDF